MKITHMTMNNRCFKWKREKYWKDDKMYEMNSHAKVNQRNFDFRVASFRATTQIMKKKPHVIIAH